MYRYMKNEKGFTLLSMLVSLSLIMLLVPLFLEVSTSILAIKKTSYQDDLDWRQFHFFISQELRDSHAVQIEGNAITFIKYDDSTPTIQLHNNSVRRRLRGGIEHFLSDVEQLSIEKIDQTTFLISGQKIGGVFYEKDRKSVV